MSWLRCCVHHIEVLSPDHQHRSTIIGIGMCIPPFRTQDAEDVEVMHPIPSIHVERCNQRAMVSASVNDDRH
jgi:hypothetical protein